MNRRQLSDTNFGGSGLSFDYNALYNEKIRLSSSRRLPQGFSPKSISTIRQPNDQTSDFLPVFDSEHSGAIQAKVPFMTVLIDCHELPYSKSLELPKSQSLIYSPPLVSKTLAPFKSPCITSFECK